MKPRGLSQNGLVRALNVPPRRVNEIVLERRGISADTALRLARYFGTSAEMWAGLQADYYLRLAGYPASLRQPVQTRSKAARARLTSWTGGNCHNESG